jgi:uncharacterized protein with PIN domain
MKLDELVCLTAWQIVFTSGEDTEKEKQRVRAMHAFYKMDADRFNAAMKDVSYSEIVEQVKKSDPITKILCIYGSLKIAFLENEGSVDGSSLSDDEWKKITQLGDATNINPEIRKAISDKAYDLINTISALENIDDEDVMELLGFEMEDTTFSDREIIPVLEVFFNKLEELDQLDIWEENFLGLTKNLRLLEELYGKIDIQQFKDRYDDLKYNIRNKKEAIERQEKLAQAEEKRKKQDLERQEKEQQKIIEKQEKEKQKLDELAELNSTHEFSVAHGITYCKYCGIDRNNLHCSREYGHRFTIKKVADPSRYSDEKFLQPVCSKCGQLGWKNRYWCN